MNITYIVELDEEEKKTGGKAVGGCLFRPRFFHGVFPRFCATKFPREFY
jgi:hypothetical protein